MNVVLLLLLVGLRLQLLRKRETDIYTRMAVGGIAWTGYFGIWRFLVYVADLQEWQGAARWVRSVGIRSIHREPLGAGMGLLFG